MVVLRCSRSLPPVNTLLLFLSPLHMRLSIIEEPLCFPVGVSSLSSPYTSLPGIPHLICDHGPWVISYAPKDSAVYDIGPQPVRCMHKPQARCSHCYIRW